MGSLLPFRGTHAFGVSQFSPKDYANSIGHPSVDSWKIQIDGSVWIREAAIIASSERTIQTPIKAIIFTIQREGNEDTEKSMLRPSGEVFVDLTAWVRSRNFDCYALCTTYGHEYSNGRIHWRYKGVLLRKLEVASTSLLHRPQTHSAYFISIGLFSVTNYGILQVEDFYPSTEVNWSVI